MGDLITNRLGSEMRIYCSCSYDNGSIRQINGNLWAWRDPRGGGASGQSRVGGRSRACSVQVSSLTSGIKQLDRIMWSQQMLPLNPACDFFYYSPYAKKVWTLETNPSAHPLLRLKPELPSDSCQHVKHLHWALTSESPVWFACITVGRSVSLSPSCSDLIGAAFI